MPAKHPALARALILSLGGLWFIDGILQLQPAMFTAAFVEQVLMPTLSSQPHWAMTIINFGIGIASSSPFWFNVAAAGIQLLIGILLVVPAIKRTQPTHVQRFALWLSIAWALAIWIFGEGFGMLATGSATFYTGAPGSALLYAILALFLLDKTNDKLEKLPVVAGIIFLAGAALNLTPMFWQPTMLSMLAMVPAVSNWLGTASLGSAQGTMLGNFFAIDALAALGIFLILMPRSRTIARIAFAFLIAIWWIGQNFGSILTFPGGTATDPNSAVVLMLFLLPAL